MTSPSPQTADALIDGFHEADMALLMSAAHTDAPLDADATRVDDALSAILSASPQNAGDRISLARFLMERFVLSTTASPALRRQAGEKLLSLVD